MNQQKLDFVRGQQLRALTRLAVKVGLVMRTTSGESVRSCHVMWVLSRLDNAAGKLGTCFKSVDTLAQETQLSPRMVRRALSAIDYAGWVIQQKETMPWGVRIHRRICWSNVLDYLDGEAAEEAGNAIAKTQWAAVEMMERQVTHQEGGASTMDAPVCPSGVGGASRASSRTIYRSAQEPPPPPQASTLEGWNALHLRLSGLGAEFPQKALSQARGAGVSMSEIANRIAYWVDRHRLAGWSVGSLVNSIAQSVPGLPVDRGWPAMVAAKQRQTEREEERRELAQAEERKKREAEAKIEQLESRWGGVISELATTPEGCQRMFDALGKRSELLEKWARRKMTNGGDVWGSASVRHVLLGEAERGML